MRVSRTPGDAPAELAGPAVGLAIPVAERPRERDSVVLFQMEEVHA